MTREEISTAILAALLSGGRFVRIAPNGEPDLHRDDLGEKWQEAKDEDGRPLFTRRDPSVAHMMAVDAADELLALLKITEQPKNFVGRALAWFRRKPKHV